MIKLYSFNYLIIHILISIDKFLSWAMQGVTNICHTFARITRIIVRDNGHYFGFATDVVSQNKYYFSSNARVFEIYVGPLILTADVDVQVTRKQIIFGPVSELVDNRSKLRVFRWWYGNAYALRVLRERLTHNISTRRGFGVKLFDDVGKSDGMYCLLRIVLAGDMNLIVNMLAKEGIQEIHISRTKENYTLRRGYKLKRNPIEFVACLAVFLDRVDLLETLFNLLIDVDISDENRRLMDIYSVDEASRRILEKKKKYNVI